MYTPPFEITSRIIELISVVSEKIGEIQYLQDSAQHIRLRKENRIKTIHASLAIENNNLSIEQITAIIDGKRVLGNPNEIKEVENSIQAYDLLLSLDPCSEKDLLKAHALMMRDLVGRSGKYWTDGVGIFDSETVVHLAPPAERVPALMYDLFAWLKASDVHPLIKSCVFHYEFEFIHPFQDGNGRMGRLWQMAILKDWKAIFAWLPVETLVKEHQKEYYDALGANDRDANSTGFIEFMLALIAGTIENIIEAEKRVTASVTQKVCVKVTPKVTVNVTANQQKIIDAIKANPFVTQEELVAIVGIARKNIIANMKKLQESGLIKRIGADKNGHWQAGGMLGKEITAIRLAAFFFSPHNKISSAPFYLKKRDFFAKPAYTKLITKIKFMMCRFIQKQVQKNGVAGLDFEYWNDKGWLGKSRPWKN